MHSANFRLIILSLHTGPKVRQQVVVLGSLYSSQFPLGNKMDLEGSKCSFFV